MSANLAAAQGALPVAGTAPDNFVPPPVSAETPADAAPVPPLFVPVAMPADPLVRRAGDEQVRNAYRFIFALPEGQIVLADLCAHAGMSSDVADAQAQRFLGARRVILRILALARVSEADVMRRLLLQAASASPNVANQGGDHGEEA